MRSGTSIPIWEPGVYVRTAHAWGGLEKAILYGWNEREEAARFLSLAKAGMTVFDVGANVGFYSLLLAARVGPTGSVHSFEPTPRVAGALRTNVQLNDFAQVKVNQIAMSDSCGTTAFYVHDDDVLSSFGGVSQTAIDVATLTIDAYLEQNGIRHVDLIKIDVEGAEVRVLRGASRLLSAPDAPIIMIEVSPQALARIGDTADLLINLLHAYGYHLTTLAEHDGYRNVLACK